MLIYFILSEELCKTDFRTVTFESFELFPMFDDFECLQFDSIHSKAFRLKTSLLSLFEVKMTASKSKGKNIRLDKKNSSVYFEAYADH